MTKFLDLLNGKIPEYSGAIIIPVDNPKITVIESCFDGDPRTDWMHIKSPYLLGKQTVTEWAANHSGLENWDIVEGYPHMVQANYEWRLRRW